MSRPERVTIDASSDGNELVDEKAPLLQNQEEDGQSMESEEWQSSSSSDGPPGVVSESLANLRMSGGTEVALRMSVDGVAPPHMGPTPRQSIQTDDRWDVARKKSLLVVYFTMFAASMGFSIFLPLMWFYYSTFDECQCPHHEKKCAAEAHCNYFQGLIVGAFPFGQVLGSPLLGWLSSKRPTREVVILSMLLTAGGYVLFSNSKKGYILLISRVIVGFGAGNSAPLRAYASQASTLEDRNIVMTKMSAAQNFGVILGPGLGFLFSLAPTWCVNGVCVDRYQTAGYFATLLTLINIVVFFMGFADIPQESKVLPRTASGKMARKAAMDWPATLAVMFFFGILWAVFSVFEGIGPQITERFFNWSAKQNSLFLLGMAGFSIIGFILIKPLTGPRVTADGVALGPRMSDRLLLIVAFAVVLLSFIPVVDWNWQNRHITLWQWIVGSMILSFSFPIATTMAYALFSKIVPLRKQGHMMGWLTVAGSLARMAGPPAAAAGYTVVGYHTYAVYFSCAGLVAWAIGMVVGFYGRLKPCAEYDTPNKEIPDKV